MGDGRVNYNVGIDRLLELADEKTAAVVPGFLLGSKQMSLQGTFHTSLVLADEIKPPVPEKLLPLVREVITAIIKVRKDQIRDRCGRPRLFTPQHAEHLMDRVIAPGMKKLKKYVTSYYLTEVRE